MKLLLDEQFSPQIAKALRDNGRDVLALRELRDEPKIPDAEVIEIARPQQRAVATNNITDFRPLANAAVLPGAQGHWGMIFVPSTFPRRAEDIGRLVAALEAKLAAHPHDDSLVNQETWL